MSWEDRVPLSAVRLVILLAAIERAGDR